MNMKIITSSEANCLLVILKDGTLFECEGIEYCDDHIELDDWIEIPYEEVETIIEDAREV